MRCQTGPSTQEPTPAQTGSTPFAILETIRSKTAGSQTSLADEIKTNGAWLRQAVQEEYQPPDNLVSLIENARKETALWYEYMYQGMKSTERAEIDGAIDETLSISERHMRHARLRARNHILLSRRKRVS